MTRMSLNKIAASKPNRRTGWSVTSAASSGVLHQFEKGMFLLELAIFRQRAAGLAHEPDGRAVHRLAAAGD